MYTFENRCREDLNLALGDQAVKIILNTKGCVGEVSQELKDLLHYMDGFTPENNYTRELDSAVAEIRMDEKWRREYMVLVERDRENRRIGVRTGRVDLVRRSRNRFNIDELSSIYYIDMKTVQAILDAIDAHPDWNDEEIAENVDFD